MMWKPTLSIKFDRWPWQRCSPHWSHMDKTPKRWGWGKVPGMARFGGGWDFKLGVQYSAWSLIKRRAKMRCGPDAAHYVKNDKGQPRSYWGSTVILNLIWGTIDIHSKTFFGPTLTEAGMNEKRLVCSGRCCELFEDHEETD